jgi:hypothetical protein
MLWLISLKRVSSTMSDERNVSVVVKRLNLSAGAAESMYSTYAITKVWGTAAKALEDIDNAYEVPLLLNDDCPPGMEKAVLKCLDLLCKDVEEEVRAKKKRKLVYAFDKDEQKRSVIRMLMEELKDLAKGKDDVAANKLKAMLSVAIKEDIPPIYWALVPVVNGILLSSEGGWLAKAVLEDVSWEALVFNKLSSFGINDFWRPLKLIDGKSVRSILASDAIVYMLQLHTLILDNESVYPSIKTLVDNGELSRETAMREAWATEAMQAELVKTNDKMAEVQKAKENLVNFSSILMKLLPPGVSSAEREHVVDELMDFMNQLPELAGFMNQQQAGNQ